MALWGWNGAEYEKQPWHRLSRPGKAVLFGCGPSLNTADTVEKGAVRFVQNHAFKKVEPNIWIGMDKPLFFGEELLELPCRKIFRGPHAGEKVGDKFAKDYGEVYWADLLPAEKSHIWFARGLNTKFLWTNNTLTVALHVILWMGFKEIIFSGIDLGGDYFDNREMDEKDTLKVKNLFERELGFMTWFSHIAKEQGIKLINRSKTSRLAAIMETA